MTPAALQSPLLFGLELTVAGLVIVFAVLGLIAWAIALMRRLDEGFEAREYAERREALERAPTIDETTLVLIAAAATAVLAGRRGRIRRIRRIADGRETWSLAGRQNILGSHHLSKSGGH